MKYRSQVITFVCLCICIAVIFWTQSTVLLGENPEENPELDLYYVPHPDYIRMLSLGFDEFAADIYWIRTVLYFGRRSSESDADFEAVPLRGEPETDPDYISWKKDAAFRFRYFYDLLNIVTELDPYMFIPYTLGGLFLSIKANRPDLAVSLLDRGLKYFPNEWQIQYLLGFNYYFYLDDTEKSAEYFMRAAQLPGSPEIALNLAQGLLVKTGKKDIAIDFISGMRDKAEDPGFKEKMEQILEALKADSTKTDSAKRTIPKSDINYLQLKCGK